MTDEHINKARRVVLNTELLRLSEWAKNRTLSDHNDHTTLSILNRRVKEIVDRVNRAGWDAAETMENLT